MRATNDAWWTANDHFPGFLAAARSVNRSVSKARMVPFSNKVFSSTLRSPTRSAVCFGSSFTSSSKAWTSPPCGDSGSLAIMVIVGAYHYWDKRGNLRYHAFPPNKPIQPLKLRKILTGTAGRTCASAIFTARKTEKWRKILSWEIRNPVLTV